MTVSEAKLRKQYNQVRRVFFPRWDRKGQWRIELCGNRLDDGDQQPQVPQRPSASDNVAQPTAQRAYDGQRPLSTKASVTR